MCINRKYCQRFGKKKYNLLSERKTELKKKIKIKISSFPTSS